MINLWQKIIERPKIHSRFLNTLAMMEFIGAQKIARSLRFLPKSLALLEHVNEEFRHAYFLRAQSLKLDNANDDFSPVHTLNFHQSRNYIGKLDILMMRLTKSANLLSPPRSLPYLLTTYAVETRALPFYESYQLALSNAGLPIKLQSIIAEEKSHLNQINEAFLSFNVPQVLKDDALMVEEKLFHRWVAGLEKAIAN